MIKYRVDNSANDLNSNGYLCCLSDHERMQLERSKQIDRELAALKRRFRATQKIVLLGAGESGKSTFLKQMQIIHGSGFSDQDKLVYRTQIYENVLKGMAGLLNGKRELKLPWCGAIQPTDDGITPSPTEIASKMINVLKNFLTIYKQLMDDRELLSMRQNNKQIHITPDQFRHSVYLIIEIWNDDSIRETFDRRREFPKYFVENVPYYIENLDKISRSDYVPDSDDILRSRRATSGINEIEMDIRNVPFRFVDVGGQRTQRQKWHQCFSDVTAILFLASSSEYDEYLREDGETNRLEESCKVFETLVNYKYLESVEFILFLNKHDLLKVKIKTVDIRNYCADFHGNPCSINDVENYLVKKFTSLRRTNRNSTSRYHLNSNFDTHQSTTSLNTNREEKSIYAHFTTAIDTNNIKTIFEMVRLMIFEKNCKSIMLN